MGAMKTINNYSLLRLRSEHVEKRRVSAMKNENRVKLWNDSAGKHCSMMQMLRRLKDWMIEM
jgi:hypothetical protein